MAEKNYISSGIKKIGQIFSDTTLTYEVPNYQRDYSWEKSHIEELWEDIIDIMRNSSEEYFLGSFVFNNKEHNRISIVDGQQRLASLTMIFAAIRDRYLKIQDSRRASGVQNDFIAKTDRQSLQDKPILRLNLNDHIFFNKYIQKYEAIDKETELKKEKKLRKSHKLVLYAYNYFKERIEEEISKKHSDNPTDFLVKLENVIKDNIIVLVTYVSNESEAYIVFETLNDRGLELSINDLLKNHLFSKSKEDIQLVQKTWQEIVNILENHKVNSFLRHYWLSTRGLIKEKKLFPAFKKEIKTKEDVVKIVSDLKKYAGLYNALHNPEDSYWEDPEMAELIEELVTLKNKLVLPVLLSAFQKYELKQLKTILRDLINFNFRYTTICNYHNNKIEKLYSKLAIDITKNNISIDEIKKRLRPLYPSDDEFINLFKEKTIKDSKLARYILGKINDFITNDDEYKTPNPPKITLEHIYPKNPDSSWDNVIKSSEIDFNELLYRIGNMTLLGKEYNRKSANKTFNEKLSEIYSKSSIVITKNLSQFSSWGEKEISERQKVLGETAAKIWQIGF